MSDTIESEEGPKIEDAIREIMSEEIIIITDPNKPPEGLNEEYLIMPVGAPAPGEEFFSEGVPEETVESEKTYDALADICGIKPATTEKKEHGVKFLSKDDLRDFMNIRRDIVLSKDDLRDFMNIRRDIDMDNLKNEIIVLKSKLNSMQESLMLAKMEVVKRDAIIIDYMKKDLDSEILVTSNNYKEMLEHISYKYDIQASNWSVDTVTGEIVIR